MEIYVISLLKDEARRLNIKKNFPNSFYSMKVIIGVEGFSVYSGDYFKYVYPYYKKHKRLITPSELGASLSHIEALRNFVESESMFSLILEDDIIGDDKLLEDIRNLIPFLGENEIIICGGQTSNGVLNYQLGKKTSMSNVMCLSQFSYSYVYGACCYLISRKAALHILKNQNNYLKLADNWDLFFKNTDFKLLFTNILKHPDDRAFSNIEFERKYLREPKNLFQRIISGRFFVKNFNLVKNYLIIIVLFIMGYRRIR